LHDCGVTLATNAAPPLASTFPNLLPFHVSSTPAKP
jgi:hypothetical protein